MAKNRGRDRPTFSSNAHIHQKKLRDVLILEPSKYCFALSPVPEVRKGESMNIFDYPVDFWLVLFRFGF